MKLDRLNKMLKTESDSFEEVKRNMAILDRIHELLNEKFGGKQKLLAAKMDKKEPEISKMLSGVQNYTMSTIIKLEKAFGAPILAVCSSENCDVSEFTYYEVKFTHQMPSCNLEVSSLGIEENIIEYQELI